MSTLQDIQLRFQAYLMSGEPDFKASVVDTETVSRETRLGIYKDAFQIRLVEALASNFPCLQTYMGYDDFQQLGLSYLARHPSHFRSIRWFGDRLADYLRQDGNPFLAELAEFEWNMSAAFDAGDAATLELSDMASLPGEAWADLTFTAHPSVRRMNFFWNVVPLWQRIADKETTLETPVKCAEASAWILWRKDYVNRFLSLSEEEAWAIDAAVKGASFAEICEGLCTWNDESEVGMRAASLLKGWIISGWLSAA